LKLTIEKALVEIDQLLSKTTVPGRAKRTYREILSDQLHLDGSWDEDFLDSVKQIILEWIKKQKSENVQSLWTQTESFQENYEGKNLSTGEVREELAEELLNSLLDSLEDNYEEEDSYTPKKNKKRNYDEDEDFDDLDFGDSSYDDYEDDYDDRY